MEKVKNVLVVCQYYYPESIGLTDICEDLARRGYKITVLTGLPNYPEGKVPKEYKFFKKRCEEINGVKIKRCFEIGRRKGKVWLALNYISFLFSSVWNVFFLKKNYDKVFCYQHSPITMGIPAVLYKKMHKKSLTLYCFDLWPESLKTYKISENSILFKILKRVSKMVYCNCDEILISSKPFKQYLTETHGIAEKKINYLPQHSKDYGCAKVKSVDSKVHFLFAGNIGKMRNIQCILKAVNEIKRNNSFVVDIVGYGSDYDELVSMTKDMDIEDCVVFHGRKTKQELQEYYDLADAMLLTLKGDSFVGKTLPLKLQSYMSTSKPIFASIDGAAKDVIEESKCGVCVKPDDYIALSKNMLDFINNKEKFFYMGKNGRAYFDKEFTFQNMMKKLVKYF